MGFSNIVANTIAQDVSARSAQTLGKDAMVSAARMAAGQVTSDAASRVASGGKSVLGSDSFKLSTQAAALAPMADPAGSIVHVYFNDDYKATIAENEPLAKASPTNTDKGVYDVINHATTSIDGSFYDIEDLGVTQALIAAKQRGVNIRLVTDTDNLVDKVDPTKPREAIVQLKAAGIPIVDDQRSAIMHDKYMIADGSTVWTGSANLTPRSLYDHNNNALTIQSKPLSDQFEAEFKRLFELREFGSSDRPVIAPNAPVQLANGQVQVYFSPDGGARQAVLDELGKAQKSIKFMTFSLTDPDIGNLIKAKAKDGVTVQGVFDRYMASGHYSLENTFHADGLGVYKDGNEALMHHKVIIVDDQTVITGSYNFSANAEHNNNEAMLVIHDAPDVAGDYVAEFDRIRSAAENNHPPTMKGPDAEGETA